MNAIERTQFKNLLNRNILFPLFFWLLTIIFFVGIISYLFSLSRSVEQGGNIVSASNVMMKLMVDQEAAMRGFALTRNENYLQPYRSAEQLLPATIEKLHRALEGNTEQTQQLEAIANIYRQWHDYAEGVIAVSRSGKDVENRISPLGKQLMDQIRGQSETMLAALADTRARHNANAQALVIALVAGFFVLSLLLNSVLAYLGRRQMINMASEYERLLRDLDLQNVALHDEEWLRVGELGLAEQIIGQLPLPILCQNVLAYLAERIDVFVGALYVGNSDDQFRREANYGFAKSHAQHEQHFARNEGLIGRAIAEDRVIVLNEVPADYLKVSSGIGESAPLRVVLVPIRSETFVIAVMELGFFRDIEQRDLVFLDRISDNIGAAIAAAIYRRRLHEGLLDMQQLNDELQAQQQELQKAYAELEEQSQTLEESQQRLKDKHSELEKLNLALKDSNEILRSTRNLLEQRALQLEQASQYKSEFLANMSHELRTPLNSALILSKLLADNAQKNLTEEQQRFANAIHSAGKDLLALINDVLDLSKVEAGKVNISPGETPVVRVVDGLRTYFEPLALEKNLQFSVKVAEDVPAVIRTDRQRLEQILRNLLSNAFKFTTRGGVHLSVSAAENNKLTFAVTDSGIGINPDRQELIFEPFHQVDSSSNRKYGGAGLGLSISRDLARLLHGTISVASTPGEGSTFTLEIPIEFRGAGIVETPLPRSKAKLSTPAEPSPAPVEIPMPDFTDDRQTVRDSDRTILVVEDEIKFARVLYDLANELGYRCLVATSAEAAFELASQYRPHAILLDMKLPDHSGLTVLARLKEEPLTRHIPVHVMSAEERSAIALRMGAVSFALKPISPEQLRELFATIEKHSISKTKNVLVVENFSQRTDNTARLISGEDVNATTVAMGEQALRLLKERAFDCVVTDYELPDMAATQLLNAMTTEEIPSRPPVIVHSPRNLNREEEAELLRHSHSIVIKGVRSPERLLDEVTLFLHRAEADLSDEKKAALRQLRNSNRALENRKILIVDDDVRNVFALISVLEGKGAKVAVGRNGLDAIQKLNEMSDIDLVLMDMMMPEMDGYEAIEKIRQDDRFAQLPIIAVTARAMLQDQEQCLRAGASDYMAKPINLDRLISLVRVWLPQVQRA